MNKILLTIALFLVGAGAMAQTTALDFTKADCAGTNHNLFAKLDSGQVVVLEFFMLNCQPCVTGGNALKNIVSGYATTQPNRVKFYSMGYNNAYTCAQINTWRASNNFTHTCFAGGDAQVNYYGGMGMPTVVVLAGSQHTVLYNNQGYSSAEIAPINAAITAGLALTTLSAQNQEQMYVHTDVLNNNLRVTATMPIQDIQIFDVAGKLVQNCNYINANFKNISINNYNKGLYFIKLRLENGQILTKKFVKAS